MEGARRRPRPGGAPGQWTPRATLRLATGRLRAGLGDNDVPPRLFDVDTGHGPGSYTTDFGYTGREEILAAALRVGATAWPTMESDDEALQSLHGIEQYLIRLWPAPTGTGHADVRTGESTTGPVVTAP